ncbi:hypothetical protein PSEUBRA_001888 [Kalmanozyma brasiliensis GHG001]|uniref:uncharacterized protein n=1 Tax=Kalmanozyma brasiliensis (strain GHG001) TaxID=1365824 RepID=UPI002867C79C|nr:uncharacterized protein PSEUBRA_001888 [Kalmanozyma brasiliensis GHG001]KAF6767011.1 hypothetical protein PSEUBRA_001888 [Kalmanozyma brasiliensis GHG001]
MSKTKPYFHATFLTTVESSGHLLYDVRRLIEQQGFFVAFVDFPAVSPGWQDGHDFTFSVTYTRVDLPPERIEEAFNLFGGQPKMSDYKPDFVAEFETTVESCELLHSKVVELIEKAGFRIVSAEMPEIDSDDDDDDEVDFEVTFTHAHDPLGNLRKELDLFKAFDNLRVITHEEHKATLVKPRKTSTNPTPSKTVFTPIQTDKTPNKATEKKK